MMGFKTWWRRFGGLMAALVVAVMAAAPTADLLLCSGEGVPAVAAGAAPAADLVASGGDHHRSAPSHQDQNGVCTHGHCHHAGGCAGAEPVQVSQPVSLARRLAVPEGPDPVSYLNFDLDRPPRA